MPTASLGSGPFIYVTLAHQATWYSSRHEFALSNSEECDDYWCFPNCIFRHSSTWKFGHTIFLIWGIFDYLMLLITCLSKIRVIQSVWYFKNFIIILLFDVAQMFIFIHKSIFIKRDEILLFHEIPSISLTCSMFNKLETFLMISNKSTHTNTWHSARYHERLARIPSDDSSMFSRGRLLFVRLC
jgi:hypothetical protein